MQRPRKKSDALTITRKPKPVQRRPRSRSSLLAEKLASFGPDAGDFPDPDEFYDGIKINFVNILYKTFSYILFFSV